MAHLVPPRLAHHIDAAVEAARLWAGFKLPLMPGTGSGSTEERPWYPKFLLFRRRDIYIYIFAFLTYYNYNYNEVIFICIHEYMSLYIYILIHCICVYTYTYCVRYSLQLGNK